MRLLHLLPALALLLACSTDQPAAKLVRLEGNLDGCVNVQQVCLESFPPQCFDFCADEDPGEPGDGGGCADVQPGETEPGSGGGDDDTEPGTGGGGTEPGTGGGSTEPGSGGDDGTGPDRDDLDVDVQICDDDVCVIGLTEDGIEVQLCYPSDCTVSSDAETGTESIECPPRTTPPVLGCEIDGAIAGFPQYPEASCGLDGAEPVCTVVPEYCPEYYGPVCGCDGVTYANDCYAAAAAVSLLHQGECDELDPPQPL